MEFLQFILDNSDKIVAFVIGLVVTLFLKKVLTPDQKKQATEIGAELQDIIEKTINLIIDIEKNPEKHNVMTKTPVIADIISGKDKHNIAVDIIKQSYDIKEQSKILHRFDDFSEFVKDCYKKAKPILSIIRLIKGK